MSGLVKLAMLLSGSGVAGFPGRRPDIRDLGKCRMSGLEGPDVLPLVLLIRGLGDLYIFMRIFGRALLVPNNAQHLGLR